MLTNTNAQFSDANTYISDFLVDTKSFEELRERITEQYLKNIEIPGFRKGMAPREKAMQKADYPYLENLVWNETITRTYTEAERIVNQKLTEEKRTLTSISLSQNPDTIGIVDNKGFKYQLITTLLPDVDLDVIEKIELKEPVAADLPERLSFKEFDTREQDTFLKTFNEYNDVDSKIKANSRIIADVSETNVTDNIPEKESKDVVLSLGTNQFPPEFEKNLIGLSKGDNKEFEINVFSSAVQKDLQFKFKITVKSVQEGKFKTIAELIEGSPFVKEQFKSIEDFNKGLQDTYDAETANLLKDIKTKIAMTAAVSKTANIELDEAAIKSETDRIFEELSKNPDPVKSFNDAKFPFVEIATKKTLKEQIENYVRGEFKIAKLCLVIYYQKITNKTTETEIQKFEKEIAANPTKYGYPQDIKKEDLKDRIFDNILRNRALEWLLNTVKFN